MNYSTGRRLPQRVRVLHSLPLARPGRVRLSIEPCSDFPPRAVPLEQIVCRNTRMRGYRAMNIEEVKPEAGRKTAAALVELLAICPVCGCEAPALYESQAECCRLYLALWFIHCAA